MLDSDAQGTVTAVFTEMTFSSGNWIGKLSGTTVVVFAPLLTV